MNLLRQFPVFFRARAFPLFVQLAEEESALGWSGLPALPGRELLLPGAEKLLQALGSRPTRAELQSAVLPDRLLPGMLAGPRHPRVLARLRCALSAWGEVTPGLGSPPRSREASPAAAHALERVPRASVPKGPARLPHGTQCRLCPRHIQTPADGVCACRACVEPVRRVSGLPALGLWSHGSPASFQSRIASVAPGQAQRRRGSPGHEGG